MSNRSAWLCANPRCGVPHHQRRVLGIRRGPSLVVVPSVRKIKPMVGGAVITCPDCGTERTWHGPCFKRLDVVR